MSHFRQPLITFEKQHKFWPGKDTQKKSEELAYSLWWVVACDEDEDMVRQVVGAVEQINDSQIKHQPLT